MDARTQDTVARLLHNALDGKVVVSRSVFRSGNLERREQCTPHELIAAWLQKGWGVDLVRGTVDERQLVLIPGLKEGD